MMDLSAGCGGDGQSSALHNYKHIQQTCMQQHRLKRGRQFCVSKSKAIRMTRTRHERRTRHRHSINVVRRPLWSVSDSSETMPLCWCRVDMHAREAHQHSGTLSTQVPGRWAILATI